MNAAEMARHEVLTRLMTRRQGQRADVTLLEMQRALFALSGQALIQARHLDLLADELMAVIRYGETDGREGTRRLMIQLPPRHGKSALAARAFPLTALARNPHWRIMLASYGATLSEGHSRAIRNAIRSGLGASYPALQLSADSTARETWELTAGGGVVAVGKGGSVTGKGGNLLIVDDLIRSSQDADSLLQRDRDWKWYEADFITRAEPNAPIVVIGTRWHLDDVQGRLLMQQRNDWRVICLPALAEADQRPDYEWRAPGEALWPARYDAAELNDRRRKMSAYMFEALYQQRPVVAEGNLFKRARLTDGLISILPADLTDRVRFWDLALSSDTRADYTVGALMGRTREGRYVVLDVARFQADWDEVVPRIATQAQLDGPGVRVGVESSFYQTAAVKKLCQRPDLHHYAIRGIPTGGRDKLTRALPFLSRVGEGLVSWMRSSWTEGAFDELCAFPGGPHDDQVDALSGAYAMLDAKERKVEVSLGRYA